MGGHSFSFAVMLASRLLHQILNIGKIDAIGGLNVGGLPHKKVLQRHSTKRSRLHFWILRAECCTNGWANVSHYAFRPLWRRPELIDNMLRYAEDKSGVHIDKKQFYFTVYFPWGKEGVRA